MKECTCDNPKYGFECVCEHVCNNSGEHEYSCEWCGLYTANSPKCNRCERNDEDEL